MCPWARFSQCLFSYSFLKASSSASTWLTAYTPWDLQVPGPWPARSVVAVTGWPGAMHLGDGFLFFEVPAGGPYGDVAWVFVSQTPPRAHSSFPFLLSPNDKRVTGSSPQKTACSWPVSMVHHLCLALTLLCSALWAEYQVAWRRSKPGTGGPGCALSGGISCYVHRK